MKKTPKLLIISDINEDIAAIQSALSPADANIVTLSSAQLTAESVAYNVADSAANVVLLDETLASDQTLLSLSALKASLTCEFFSLLIITINTNQQQLNALVDSGAADFVNKPLHRGLLLNRVQQQLMIWQNEQDNNQLLRQTLKLRELGELVALVGHEVASPIGNINTAVSFLLESTEKIKENFDAKKLASTDLEKFLGHLHKALSMCTKNCSNAGAVLTSYRKVAGNQCFDNIKPFYLHRYLDDIVLTLKSKLKNLPHDIHIVIGEAVEMTSDAGAFSQVLNGLINKSIEHAFDDKIAGTIIVSTTEFTDEHGNDKVTLNYIDDGKGLTPEQQLTLLQSNSDTATEQSKKALTTAMLKTLVEQRLQGTMQLNNETKKGIHFILELPKLVQLH
jgi:signal transduction histidine kinase